MIKTYRRSEVRALFEDGRPLKGTPADMQRRAVAKLQMLHAAGRLDDLRVPPGNRLEALTGDRKGQHSIRINEQYRVCFVWRNGNAHEVDTVDYH